MTILITGATGATGAVGRHLVDALVNKGEKVRAVSRTPLTAALPDGVEVAGPDLTPELFDGVDRVFVWRSARAATPSTGRSSRP